MAFEKQFTGHGDVGRFAGHIAYLAESHGSVELVAPEHHAKGASGVLELRLAVVGQDGVQKSAGSYKIVCERDCTSCKRTGAKDTYECGFVDGVRDAIREIAPHVQPHQTGEKSYNFTV